MTPEWAAPHVWEVDDTRVPLKVREYAARLNPPATRVIRVSEQEYVFYAADGELLDSAILRGNIVDAESTVLDLDQVFAAHGLWRFLRMALTGFAVLSLLAVLAISIVEGLR
jgi:hypothetical protein